MFNDCTSGQSYVGDRTRVQQILMNLVSNAIKFTAQGEVEVTAIPFEREDGKSCIRLTVRDSGIGIAQENLPTIFDKFTQADETITRRYGGSGLGLSIACFLAKLMDGDIQVESTLGSGSTFTAVFFLTPCEEDEIAPAPAGIVADEHRVAPHSEILLVEDYAPNVLVATLVLEDLGYIVTSAENGSRAIEILQARTAPFFAILMDVQMSGMDGLETTRKIREIEQQKNFTHTIIGVTAHALAGDRERCLNAGMDDYVSKPIHPDILATKLRMLA